MTKPIQYIDTHCHLYSDAFDNDRAQTLARAFAGGLSHLVLPNIDTTTIEAMHNTCLLAPRQCFPAIGLHPCSVKEDYLAQLKTMFDARDITNYIAIGEIGIDLYWDKTLLKEQIHALEIQLDMAVQYQLPVILHCRDAFDEMYDVVRNYSHLRGVFHAFSGTEAQANAVISRGFYVGIGGVVTFKNGGLDKILPHIPLSHMVLETDAPYLTPAPNRGKRNEPSYLNLIATKMSEILHIDIEAIAETTSKNAMQLFSLK